jgi:hypothetical protein
MLQIGADAAIREPSKETTSGGGSIIGVVIGAGIALALLHNSQQKKPVNLPSPKKMSLDLEHIASGHMPGGNRNPDGKKSVFWGLSTEQVIRAIYEAYQHSSKQQTQGDRIRLIGTSDSFGLIIEMWINVITNVIETAYPKG